MNLLIQTICGTGIRVSELQYITVEAIRCGEAVVSLKGKTRSVFIVRELQKKSVSYTHLDVYKRQLRDLHREGAKLTVIPFSWFGALSHFDTVNAEKILF